MSKTTKAAASAAEVKYPRRDARRRETRKRILEAAGDLFQAKGYDEVKMADIAEAADVHITTLFIHFGAKRDLADALADEQIEGLARMIDEARGSVPFFTFFRRLVAGWAGSVRHGEKDGARFSHDVRANPELTFSWLGQHKREIALYARYFAEDFGLDPDEAMLPYLVANMLTGACVIAHDRWLRSGGASDLKADALHGVDLCQEMVEATQAGKRRQAT